MTTFVLILWLGAGFGGPAAIDGFTSRATCEAAAVSIVKKQAASWYFGPSHLCVEVRK